MAVTALGHVLKEPSVVIVCKLWNLSNYKYTAACHTMPQGEIGEILSVPCHGSKEVQLLGDENRILLEMKIEPFSVRNMHP